MRALDIQPIDILDEFKNVSMDEIARDLEAEVNGDAAQLYRDRLQRASDDSDDAFIKEQDGEDDVGPEAAVADTGVEDAIQEAAEPSVVTSPLTAADESATSSSRSDQQIKATTAKRETKRPSTSSSATRTCASESIAWLLCALFDMLSHLACSCSCTFRYTLFVPLEHLWRRRSTKAKATWISVASAKTKLDARCSERGYERRLWCVLLCFARSLTSESTMTSRSR